MALSPEDIDRHVGARLRFLREACGFSQAYLGKSVGLTFQQIQKYEQGSNRISASKLWQLADLLGVTPNNFFDGLDREQPLNDTLVSRDVAEAALQLHQLEDPDVKRNMLELIRLCKSRKSA
ncbi:helix-turn-helix transcriptional regulator [Aestuariicoccus sp. MJ-SS9]|uniref:helix-turn-helix domain-containing protein n=1 Tax=Aestuariicoccus sp. MJ-SS9 TaxID=3079855 RepID=UPI00290F3CDE|nr:helix-turn-helix transcriptional regulator [Aestuariicoccus sp. MJ-SS9]MDU8910165.1 helix-turn-helix transcriptional regulator [Aestuariicoccus sp. MJ-SS9]